MSGSGKAEGAGCAMPGCLLIQGEALGESPEHTAPLAVLAPAWL